VILIAGGEGLLVAETSSSSESRVGRGFYVVPDGPSLDGRGNNRDHPEWGQAGAAYLRVARARYADGRSAPVTGVDPRTVSNRIFNDVNQNISSERRISQWGFTWGQFLDHSIGLRSAPTVGNTPDPSAHNIPFDNDDPLEEFANTVGHIPFTRSDAAPGTGVTNARQQVNTLNSYIDAEAVYGNSNKRLEWLRAGPVNGSLSDNSGSLLLSDGYLPRRDARGDADTAPTMDIDGRLRATPSRAVVAGDVRANENVALQATHTLFAREHNRIVDRLPSSLSGQAKFDIARRVVMAEQQYITYTEFLPTLGVRLPAYRGYDPEVNPTLGNEFATVGYRAHSMIHGEIEVETEALRYGPAQIAAFEAAGVEVAVAGGNVMLAIPLNVAFFNPDLLSQVQLGPMLQGIGLETQYKNDEQIDNQLRSVLFQIPVPGNPQCLDGTGLPECFRQVVDLGAVDIQRGRDHGMPSYNQLRAAYGLAPKTSFRAITGESTESFPADPQLTRGDEVNDPDSLDFVALFDIDGNPVELGSEEAETSPTRGVRRTTTAARLRAVHGSVRNLDAFTGMIAERHVPGSEFGELQLAIWRKQFQALRDGDRYFYSNDPALTAIRRAYGIDFRRTLGRVITDNTDLSPGDVNDNVFLVPAEESAEAPAQEPAEAPAEAPAERSAEAPAEASAEAPAERSAEAPAERSAEAPAESASGADRDRGSSPIVGPAPHRHVRRGRPAG
jgi:hypothetical protein